MGQPAFEDERAVASAARWRDHGSARLAPEQNEPVAVRGAFALKTEMLRDQIGED